MRKLFLLLLSSVSALAAEGTLSLSEEGSYNVPVVVPFTTYAAGDIVLDATFALRSNDTYVFRVEQVDWVGCTKVLDGRWGRVTNGVMHISWVDCFGSQAPAGNYNVIWYHTRGGLWPVNITVTGQVIP